jgi:exodeoxyribonuclease V beta subunit
MAEALDAARFPLWGSRLIEASAGTGKTWTIAALYLRLVLGHGGEAGFARPLLPAEILVMTFTRAATRELSDRIRARLLEAAGCFRGEAVPADDDHLLAELMATYAPGAQRQGAAWRLAMAADGMDDAAVHTIDAWCQRMLREHAFDSGCLFDEELVADERAMLLEATRDYWRQQVYPLPAAALDIALGVWRGVEALAEDVQALSADELPAAADDGSLGACIERVVSGRETRLGALKQGWADGARAMQSWLDGLYDAPASPLNKAKLNRRNYSAWLDVLAQWAGDPRAELPDLKTGATRLSPDGLREVFKPGAHVDPPPQFEAFARLVQSLAVLPTPAPALRLHAATRVQRRLAQLKQQAGSFGFADMLSRLDQALDVGQGASAERLRQRILDQYPVALVDEFQDTSPLQARIFDRLYQVSENRRNTALLLIGDPKQSIYGFRGADIHAYLDARRATADRHYVLGTNHRSTRALVAAVNQVFGRAERREGEGAFMFRVVAPEAGAAAGANALPFIPVAARGRSETLVTSAGAVPAMSLALDAELRDTQTSRRLFAEHCAERIVTLLNDRGAGFDEPDRGFTRLRPADMAVLVRSGREARAVRVALRRRGVASVYLSDRDSVFASAEAADLLRLLEAVAAPQDLRLARAALATRTVGLALDELVRLAADDASFDARCEQLRQLHAVWQGQGVLAMLRQALHLLGLPARCLSVAADGSGAAGTAAADGERQLTNILHLAELLQAASARLDGEQALIRWLATQMQGDAGSADEQIVRLESDADLVKVVTVYKAKGLEYPLVFLPFACSFRGVDKARASFVSLTDGEGRRTLHLEPADEQIAAADKERQREDLRLLYVALTRARHALWVGLAALRVGPGTACTAHRSAFGYLLGGASASAAAGFGNQVEALARDVEGIVVERAAVPGQAVLRTVAEAAPLREPVAYTADFERRWVIGSFTALVRAVATPASLSTVVARDDEVTAPAAAALQEPAPEPLREPRQDTVATGGATVAASPAVAAGAEPLAAAAAAAWHGFPRGAVPGNFLHDQLEWLAGEGFALDSSPACRRQLQRRCEQQGWGHHAAAVQDWLAAVVSTVLPPVGAALVALRRPLPEMEFWFPSDGLAAAQLDALCRSHLLDGRERPPLPEREWRGMLMGFADLVFEHGGRWWVLDYKSNALGSRDADYDAGALQAAMAEHRYDVQAALYLLALHRLLRLRLGPAYEPARQLGGAVYFFIRGIHGPAHGCHHVPAAPALLDALDALLQGTERVAS